MYDYATPNCTSTSDPIFPTTHNPICQSVETTKSIREEKRDHIHKHSFFYPAHIYFLESTCLSLPAHAVSIHTQKLLSSSLSTEKQMPRGAISPEIQDDEEEEDKTPEGYNKRLHDGDDDSIVFINKRRSGKKPSCVVVCLCGCEDLRV